MLECKICWAVISEQEATEAIEIAGPGYPTICTGCAHGLAEDEEEHEQAMVIPLQGTPSSDDVPNRPVEIPAKFMYYTYAGEPVYVMACGVCNKHCTVSVKDYANDVVPVCTTCEARAAELTGDIMPDVQL